MKKIVSIVKSFRELLLQRREKILKSLVKHSIFLILKYSDKETEDMLEEARARRKQEREEEGATLKKNNEEMAKKKAILASVLLVKSTRLLLKVKMRRL